MSGTSFCDVSGVRAVVRAHRRAQVLGSRLGVVITHAAVRRVFMLTGADTILRIYPALEQALSQYSTDAADPPGRPPKDDAPRIPLPPAPRTVTHPASESTARHLHGRPVQQGNVTAAGDSTLNTGPQDGYTDRAARPTGG
jgi:hypothetical protein